jgi:UDP-glucose 4-epimerase
MKKILITGGSGFVGLSLAKYLLETEKAEVTILDIFKRDNRDHHFEKLIEHPNCHFHFFDITDASNFSSLQRDYFSEIFHFAAFNGTSNFYKYPVDVLKVGTVGTINLLDWIVGQNIEKIIFTSSSETYAGSLTAMGDNFPLPTPESIPLCIDDIENPRWSYGSSKIIGEAAFFAYKEYHGIENFSIIRLHNIYGPRMGGEHVISQFIGRLLGGESPLKVYGGDCTRSFCFIDDVLNSINILRENPETNGGIYNVGNDDEEIMISELAKIVINTSGYGYDLDVRDAPAGSVRRRCPDVSKIKKLGYKKTVPLKEGIQKTFDWYRTELTNS